MLGWKRIIVIGAASAAVVACGSAASDGAGFADDSNDPRDAGAAPPPRSADAGNDARAAQDAGGRDAATATDASATDASANDASAYDAAPYDASTNDGSASDAGDSLAIVSSHRIGTGWWSTCAVREAGALYCWGYNGYGAVGDGTQTDRHTPVLVSGLDPVAQVAVGAYSACALSTKGTVSCWGSGAYGEMGDGVARSTPALLPVAVAGLTNVVELSAGAHHFCVRKSDDSLWCWGFSAHGEVGDGVFADVRPVGKIMDDVAQVSADTYNTCAAMKDGTAKCWGENVNGTDGTGTSDTPYDTPQTVSGLSGVVRVGTGTLQACALLADGTVKCWGDNAFGEIGDNTTDERLTPVSVQNLIDVAQIVPGGPGAGYLIATCALGKNGAVSCWGANGYGELGNGGTTSSLVPTAASITNVIELAVGGGHACAERNDGSLWCWGYDAYGEIGDGATTNELSPVRIF